MRHSAISPEIVNYSKTIALMGKDLRLQASHVCLYTALFVCWQRAGFCSPFSFTRKQLTAFSKIASIATYHKCIRELDAYQYIRYQPSYHPQKGSLVYWPETVISL